MIRVWRASRLGAPAGSTAAACLAVLLVAALPGAALPAPRPSASQRAGAASHPAERPDSPGVVASPSEQGTLSGFARQVGIDFRRLPSLESGLWLGLGSGASLVARPNDREVADRMARSHTAEACLDAGQWIGDEALLLPATLLLYGAGRWTDRPAFTHLSGDLFRAQLVSQALTLGVKVAVNRKRPDGTGLSFPSGHASAGFAIAAVLQRDLGWKAGAPAYATAAYVAVSRLSEHRHWLSDVVFGASLGILSGRTVALGSPESHLVLAPAVLPGCTGLALLLERSAPRP